MVRELGRFIDDSPLQATMAHVPIEVTPSGMVIEVMFSQLRNAKSSMLLTEFGSVTDVMVLQFSKADWPMQVTLSVDNQSFTFRKKQFRTIYVIVSVLCVFIRFGKHNCKMP